MKVSAIDKKTKTIGRVFSKCEYCDLGEAGGYFSNVGLL